MALTGYDLQQITDFSSLVQYLRDELDWPLETDDIEEITFDYSPEELGLKDAEAASVKHIYQLRPLAGGQPWGIFLIEFEKKKLPVVVLRRILESSGREKACVSKCRRSRTLATSRFTIHLRVWRGDNGTTRDRICTFPSGRWRFANSSCDGVGRRGYHVEDRACCRYASHQSPMAD